ncbi:thymine dioxygenase [Drepanopeziza brunnea f. sp. 'multigermtubi' MB_m1]|uniref:Thymine dioxygenase n=1 Tax=Marssonina brunnea f. sp. multigermtubi (strain MB_m1) TaxID=1072389 RepID=K1WJ77_MARBU|nr:thymine dioxygenase [Drepanopeziza brunnea f. sp. 'multigermtubi' MB_m1]EKD12931.1 thymine dioxygenase [Drepanopeziza brunnea f. sp. 'multigermtubi' MB_m1]
MVETEEKMLAPRPVRWSVHRGYTWAGLEKVTQDESVEREAKELNIWITPEVLPGFGEFMFTLYETLSATALLILEAWALGLGLSDPGKLLKLHSGMNNQLRLLHYPPIAARELEEGSSARMEEQSDWGSITLLFQDACGGLEVQVKDGELPQVHDAPSGTSAAPLNNLFTGPERMTRARYAIPYFVATGENTLVEVFKGSTNVENPAKHEAVTQKEYAAKRARLQ